MISKLLLTFSLLRSKAYVVLTDTRAVVVIPMMDMEAFDNIMLLGAQTSALAEFESKLNKLIKEHKQAISLLKHRKGGKEGK